MAEVLAIILFERPRHNDCFTIVIKERPAQIKFLLALQRLEAVHAEELQALRDGLIRVCGRRMFCFGEFDGQADLRDLLGCIITRSQPEWEEDIMNRRTVSVPDWNASMLEIADDMGVDDDGTR